MQENYYSNYYNNNGNDDNYIRLQVLQELINNYIIFYMLYNKLTVYLAVA